MIRLRTLIVGSLVAACSLLHGPESAGESRVGRWLDRSRPVGILSRSQSPQAASSSKGERYVIRPSIQQFGTQPDVGYQRRFGNGVRTVGSRLSSAIKHKTTGLADSLTPKPKVIKAVDPTSLSEDPPSISPDVYIASAQLNQFSGNQDKAAEFYNKVLELEPGNLDALIGQGRMLDRQNMYAEAAVYYEKATAHHPTNASAFNDLGLCYARHGEIAKSIRALQIAIKLKPESKLYRNNLATVLVENSQLDEAVKYLADVHGEAVAHYNVGYLLYQRGDGGTARQHFSQAVSINPQLDEARVLLARVGGAESTESQVSQELIVDRTAPDKHQQLPYQPFDHAPDMLNGPTSLAYSGVQWPTRTAQFPRAVTNSIAPMPNGESFLYSNSVIEHLPPTE